MGRCHHEKALGELLLHPEILNVLLLSLEVLLPPLLTQFFLLFLFFLLFRLSLFLLCFLLLILGYLDLKLLIPSPPLPLKCPLSIDFVSQLFLLHLHKLNLPLQLYFSVLLYFLLGLAPAVPHHVVHCGFRSNRLKTLATNSLKNIALITIHIAIILGPHPNSSRLILPPYRNDATCHFTRAVNAGTLL